MRRRGLPPLLAPYPFDETDLRSDPAAWEYWTRAAPSYKKVVIHWVTSAKRPETRARHIAEVLDTLKARKRER